MVYNSTHLLFKRQNVTTSLNPSSVGYITPNELIWHIIFETV